MARAIVRLADRPRRESSVGATNRIIELGFRLLPPVYDALVTSMIRAFGLSRRAATPTTGNVFEPGRRAEGGPGRWTRRQVGVAAGATVGAAGALALAVRGYTRTQGPGAD
jgi:hypothetical protein